MEDAVRQQLENRVHKIEEGHYELSSSMELISKDMTILSTTLVELKDIMKALANRDIEFQLFKQKTAQEVTSLSSDVYEEIKAIHTASSTNFVYTISMISVMFGLFIAYVAYMDLKFGRIEANSAVVERLVILNDEKLKSTQVQTRDLYFDVKEVRKNQGYLTNSMIK
jgi:hypothetical protein